MRRLRLFFAILIVALTVTPRTIAQDTASAPRPTDPESAADGGEVVVDPERVVVDVGRIEAVVGGLPALPPLEFAPPVLPPAIAAVPEGDDIPPPTLPRETVAVIASETAEEEVFFNATLGAGSVNSVLGSINVYRLGEGPQFRLGYDHRGSDGFNFQEPGTGFFLQQNALETWVRIGDEQPLSLEVEGRYGDVRRGLQQRPTYYSVDSRTVAGSADLTYEWSARAQAGSRVSLEDQQRVLAASAAGAVSPRESYRRVRPEVWGVLEWPRLRLEATGDYDGLFNSGSPVDDAASAGLALAIEGVPIDGLTLGVRGATRYRFSDGAFFPVEGSLEYRGMERLGIDLSGGYAVRDRSVAELWTDYAVPVVPGELAGQLPLSERVFAAGRAEVMVQPSLLQVAAFGRWETEWNALEVTPYNGDPAIAGYPVELRTMERISTGVDMTVFLGERTRLIGGWLSRLEDRSLGVPEGEISATAEFEGERLAGSISGAAPLTTEQQVPLLGAEVRYRLARDVDIRLFGNDLLGPIEDEGRTARGVRPVDGDPFVQPGFEIGLDVRVSF
jgi:hypothetical protein